MRNVNPRTVFELDELLARLKVEAFRENNLSFFKEYQCFIEKKAELPNHHFLPEIVFRKGSMLYPQQHEYSFEKLLKRNKGKIVSFDFASRIRRLDISQVTTENISSVAMSEEELLGALYCLFKGESPVRLNKDDYFYLYSVSAEGDIFSKTWLNWKGDYWSIKTNENSSIEHHFGGDNILLVV